MVVVIAALFFGLLVIGLLSRFAKNVPRTDPRSEGVEDLRPSIPPLEFEQIVRLLIRALGLDVVFGATEETGALELTCRDPRPVVGGRLLVKASSLTAAGQVDAAEILAFAEIVRADMGVLKGIYIAAAGFTDEAYAALHATPGLVELIDAPRLVALVREHLPQRVNVLERYRSFSPGGQHHRRAGWSGIDDSLDPVASR